MCPLPRGKASFNLFHIINKDIGLAASTALSRCRREHTAVTYSGIPVGYGGGQEIHRPERVSDPHCGEG